MANNSDTEVELTSLTVEELVSRLVVSTPEESSEYFEELIRRFEPLLRVTWRRVISKQRSLPDLDYEDFVHDVFVRLFSNLAHLRDARAFPGYFRQIALSVAYSYWRKQSGGSTQSFDYRDEEPDYGHEFLSHRDVISGIDEQILTGIFVRSYLEHLSEQEKRIVTLAVFEELSSAEIGQAVGLTPGAVRTTKMRAFSKLRQLILRDSRASEKKGKKG